MNLDEARRQARRVGCFIVAKPGLFLLYRCAEDRNVFVAKRSTLEAMAKLVRKMAKGLDVAQAKG